MSIERYQPKTLVSAAAQHVVGMQREAELIAVALSTGRHLVLEGPPGTGKSTLLRTIASAAGVSLHFVEGNAELTPSRLVGHHDPAIVIRSGYQPDAFVPGPLVDAVRDGGLLYLEELNRIPEESLNVLITALAEGELHVPRLGRIAAHPNFRLVAAMNPADSIGTTRVAQAVYDRLCRVSIGYQDEAHECAIVTAATNIWEVDPIVLISVLTVRGSRSHRELRSGSSVRGSIDFSLLTGGLLDLREGGRSLEPENDTQLLLDAATAALSGRIRVDEGSDRTPEDIVAELLSDAIAEWCRRQQLASASSSDIDSETDSGKANGSGPPPPGGGGRGQILTGEAAQKAVLEAGRRTSSRNELTRSDDFNCISPEVGQLDQSVIEEMFADDPDAALELLVTAANATDKSLRTAARRLAVQLVVRVARDTRQPVRGIHRLRPQTGELSGDLDLDATLARTDGVLPVSADEVVTRTWAAGRRAVCLLVDRSGSMSGHQVALAAMGAAGVIFAANEHTNQRTEVAVLGFNRDSIVLQHCGQPRSVADIVNDLLTLRGKGETDLSLALRAARKELERSAARERVVILLSDAKHTTGQLPELAAKGIDRLHVIGTGDDDESAERGAAIAAAGRGTYVRCLSIVDLPPALNALLATSS